MKLLLSINTWIIIILLIITGIGWLFSLDITKCIDVLIASVTIWLCLFLATLLNEYLKS